MLSDKGSGCLDNIPIFGSLECLCHLDCKYLIVLNDNVSDTKNELKKMLINLKVIPVRVFSVPYFDFNLYNKLLKNTPTIVARHCWGGLLYHRLGLEFNSPFVNLRVSDVDFNKLAANFEFYMSQDLVYLKDGYEKNLKRYYPIATLGDIVIDFNHYDNFSQANEKWQKRKARINWGNLLFETTTESAKVAHDFESLPLGDSKHKLCFCSEHVDSENVIDFSSFMVGRAPGTLGMLVNGTATDAIPYFNLLKLLVNYDKNSRMNEVGGGYSRIKRKLLKCA